MVEGERRCTARARLAAVIGAEGRSGATRPCWSGCDPGRGPAAKQSDFGLVLGPTVVTPDELDPASVGFRLRDDGREAAGVPLPLLLGGARALAARRTTLRPGDIIVGPPVASTASTGAARGRAGGRHPRSSVRDAPGPRLGRDGHRARHPPHDDRAVRRPPGVPEMERRIGRELTLNEVIGIEMATISTPIGEVVDWLLDSVSVRPGFAELVSAHDPLIVSAGFRELIEPVLAREGVVARLVANTLLPARTGGGQRSSSGTPARSAASPASASRSPTMARSSTSATASPTAAPRSRPIASSPATASPAGSTSRVRRMRASTTCTTCGWPS